MKKLEACKQVVIADLKEKIIAAADKQRASKDYERHLRANTVVVNGKHCEWPNEAQRLGEAFAEYYYRTVRCRPGIRLLLVTYAFLRGVPLVKVEGAHRFDSESYARVLSKKIEDIVSGIFKDELKEPVVAYLTKGLKEWLEAEEPTKLAEAAQ